MEEAAPNWVLMWLLIESKSVVSKEKAVEQAVPEEGEIVFVMQRPFMRVPDEHT